jgi:hypothetical protein
LDGRVLAQVDAVQLVPAILLVQKLEQVASAAADIEDRCITFGRADCLMDEREQPQIRVLEPVPMSF